MDTITNRYEIQVVSGPLHIGGHGLKEWRTIAYCEGANLAQQFAQSQNEFRRVLDTQTGRLLESRQAVVIPFPVASLG